MVATIERPVIKCGFELCFSKECPQYERKFWQILLLPGSGPCGFRPLAVLASTQHTRCCEPVKDKGKYSVRILSRYLSHSPPLTHFSTLSSWSSEPIMLPSGPTNSLLKFFSFIIFLKGPVRFLFLKLCICILFL